MPCCAGVIDPLTLTVSDAKLKEATDLIDKYNRGEADDVDEEKLWKAKRIKDAIVHPGLPPRNVASFSGVRDRHWREGVCAVPHVRVRPRQHPNVREHGSSIVEIAKLSCCDNAAFWA